jgi:hypothetical protein
MDPSRENFYWFEGVLWFCFMGSPGATTHFLWVHFDGKIPASNILYNILWAPADERRARIIIPAEKNHAASTGIEHLTSMW